MSTGDETPYDGVGIAMGLVAAGLVCLWAPMYLDATSGWQALWLVLGGGLGLSGLAGALLELEKLRGQSGLGDWAAALVLAGFAGIAATVEHRGIVSGRLATTAKYLVVLCLLWAVIGGGRGLARLVFGSNSIRTEARPVVLPVIATTTTAVAGLGTAIINFLRAAQG